MNGNRTPINEVSHRFVVVAEAAAVTDAAEELTARGLGCTEPIYVKTIERTRYLDVVGLPGTVAADKAVQLSPRLQQVLLLIADGFQNAEIGQRLGLTEDTVKTHVRILLRKIGAPNRAHAVLLGCRLGLIPGGPP